MAKKLIDREDREEKEFQEFLKAFHEYYEELMADSDSEGGPIAFWIDQSWKTVRIECSDGDSGSISYAEFTEIREQIGKECLICAGLLEFIFDSESKPVLYLACNRCKKIHKVVLGKLCLSND
ncbi:MAG: hypothetical protein AAB338_00765 [Patescibacteria group bacterium]